MKYLIISAFAAVGFLAAMPLLRSHSSTDHLAAPSGTISIHELNKTAGARGLPIDEFEDQSLVFSAGSKHRGQP